MARAGTVVAVAGAVASVTSAAPVWALGDDGQPIDTSEFNLDLHQGPVLAGSRVVGLAGAYTAIAENVAGYAFNPASVAQRVPWSTGFIDWELDGGFTLPSSVTEFDFDNNGDDTFSNDTAIFITAGLGLQFGLGGIGGNVDYQLYQVQAADDVLNVSLWRLMLLGGYGFFDGELIFGLGIGWNVVNIERAFVVGGGAENENRDVGSAGSPSFHGGFLWAPNYAPIRIGAAVRASLPPSAQPDARPTCVAPCVEEDGNYYVPDATKASTRFYLPRIISLPNEIWAGAAVQLFRQFNHNWPDTREEPSRHRWLKERIDRKREEREEKRAVRLSEAGAKGVDTGAMEQKLEADEEKTREEEDTLLAEAKHDDRMQRLGPYKTQPRGKLLLSAAARITLPSENGVGLDSFLSQIVERSGEKVTAGPHLGVETELWPGYVVLRGGSYLEPTRFRNGSDRWHGTGGLDIRIPVEWGVFGLFDDDNTFRVGGAIDGTVRYLGWNVSAGIWR